MALPSGPAAVTTDAELALFQLVDAYERAYETAAARVALSGPQACVLGRIAAPRGMKVLADEVGCDASNITQLVSRLEALGLVARVPNPQDGRGRLITRTPQGDRVTGEFDDAFEFAREALGRLTPAERDQLTRLIAKALG